MESEVLSPAAQVIIAITPIVGIAIGGIVVFFYLLWRHRETTLQIKTGTYLEKKFNIRLFSLLTGILLISVGIVLTVLFFMIRGISYTALGGLIPFALGIGFVIFYQLSNDQK